MVPNAAAQTPPAATPQPQQQTQPQQPTSQPQQQKQTQKQQNTQGTANRAKGAAAGAAIGAATGHSWKGRSHRSWAFTSPAEEGQPGAVTRKERKRAWQEKLGRALRGGDPPKAGELSRIG
jgi:hypothetical protein